MISSVFWKFGFLKNRRRASRARNSLQGTLAGEDVRSVAAASCAPRVLGGNARSSAASGRRGQGREAERGCAQGLATAFDGRQQVGPFHLQPRSQGRLRLVLAATSLPNSSFAFWQKRVPHQWSLKEVRVLLWLRGLSAPRSVPLQCYGARVTSGGDSGSPAPEIGRAHV